MGGGAGGEREREREREKEPDSDVASCDHCCVSYSAHIGRVHSAFVRNTLTSAFFFFFFLISFQGNRPYFPEMPFFLHGLETL